MSHSRISDAAFRGRLPLFLLIGVVSVAFLLQAILGAAAYYGLMVVPADIAMQWDALLSGNAGDVDGLVLLSLLTYAFLHGDFMHLVGNLFFLWIFAAISLELLGAKRMFLVFIATAICGGICHVALNPSVHIPMLGASAAVAGFQGLYLGMAMRWKLPAPHVWPLASPVSPGQLAALAAFYFAIDVMGVMGEPGDIAYGAHIGGFAAGLLLGGAIFARPSVAFPR